MDGPGPAEGPSGAAFAEVTQPGRMAPVLLVAVAAVAVVGLAFVTKATPGPAPSVASRSAPPPSSVGVAASPALESVSGDPETAVPSRNPNAKPFAGRPVADVRAGEIQLKPAGPAPVSIAVSLPAGWSKAGTTTVLKIRGPGANRPVVSVSAWQVRQVDTFACRWSSQPRSTTTPADPVATLAQALSSWWGQDPREPPHSNADIAPLASPPRRTSFAGHDAWSLGVLIPLGLDLGQCDAGQLVLWEAEDGEVRLGLPGEFHQLSVVDAAGAPIVIDVTTTSEASPVDLQDVQTVLVTMTIEP